MFPDAYRGDTETRNERRAFADVQQKLEGMLLRLSDISERVHINGNQASDERFRNVEFREELRRLRVESRMMWAILAVMFALSMLSRFY